MTGPIKHFDLCLITDRSLANGRSLLWIVAEAVKGGVTEYGEIGKYANWVTGTPTSNGTTSCVNSTSLFGGASTVVIGQFSMYRNAFLMFP